ncbi:MAG TPA: type IV pilus biogenesis/stability protein PilW [Luteimonas sp.]|nr:type IV pilus biogenesis/stability protein PilW [Luteimonas sp.]
MRPRDAMVLAVVTMVLVAGCSRLTFVKPHLKRHGYRQVAPEYNIREDADSNRRIATMDRIALAQQHLRAGQLDQAETEAKAVLKADSKSADAHTLLAMIDEQRGHPEQAGAHYVKAVALEPTRGAVLNNYGAWLCGNGRAAESLALFDRALADPAYPSPAAALANAGSCALTVGQTARADRDLRNALSLDPGSPVALAAMADSEYRAGRYFQARAFSERRLAAAPATPQVLQLASQIEQKLGDTAAAARYVQRIGAEFPEQGRDTQPGDASQR